MDNSNHIDNELWFPNSLLDDDARSTTPDLGLIADFDTFFDVNMNTSVEWQDQQLPTPESTGLDSPREGIAHSSKVAEDQVEQGDGHHRHEATENHDDQITLHHNIQGHQGHNDQGIQRHDSQQREPQTQPPFPQPYYQSGHETRKTPQSAYLVSPQARHPLHNNPQHPQQEQKALHTAQQNAASAPNSDTLYTKMVSSQTYWSDSAARRVAFEMPSTGTDLQKYRFLFLARYAVPVANNQLAYARGYWPKEPLPFYNVPPASNPAIDYDITFAISSELGLSINDSVNLPLPIAWIDDARMILPQPPSIGNVVRGPNGHPILGMTGKPLRNYTGLLPDRISSHVEGWRMHFWFTIDSRITYEDVIARMHFKCHGKGGEGPLSGGLDQVSQILSNRVQQFRITSGILAPLPGRFDYDTYQVSKDDYLAMSKLSQVQIMYGTWWTVDEKLGIMFAPSAKNAGISSQKDAFILPIRAGPSLRMRKILEFSNRLKNQVAAAWMTGSPLPTGPALQVSPRTPQTPWRAVPSPRKRAAASPLDGQVSPKRARESPLPAYTFVEGELPEADIGRQRQAEALIRRMMG